MAQIKSTINIENNTLTIAVEGKEPFVVDSTKLEDTIYRHAVLHGLKQKLVDSASLPAGATLTEKYLAIKETFDRITGDDPTWNKGGDGQGSAPSGLLFKALCRKYANKTPEALRAWLDKQDKSKQAALRKNPEIAAIIEEIKAESIKTAGIDTTSLLSELDELA